QPSSLPVNAESVVQNGETFSEDELEFKDDPDFDLNKRMEEQAFKADEETKRRFEELNNEFPLKERNNRIANWVDDEYSTITLEDLAAMEFPKESWIVDKIIPMQGMTLFVGESGVGKSFIALDLLKSIVTASSETKSLFLGHFNPLINVPILVIDKENGLRRLKNRISYLDIPLIKTVFFLKYSEFFTLENKEFLHEVHKLIEKENIKLVILDSFVDIITGSENSSTDINTVFNALRAISSEVSYFILHHDSKPIPHFQRSAGQRTRGSSNIIAQVDNQFYVEKTKSPKIIHIEQGKSRDNEPIKKFSLEFINDEEGKMKGFKYGGEVEESVKMIEIAQEFIYEFLTVNPYRSKDDIVSAGQMQDITARGIQEGINTLRKKGVLEYQTKEGYGNKRYYFIVSDEGLSDQQKEIVKEYEETIQ
ncbi:MAG: AAA family ATPase, partial [Chitinophagaceae bacterium]